MDKDPTHRYNLSSTYAPVRAEFMELGLMEHTIPSFELINKRGSNATEAAHENVHSPPIDETSR